MGDFRFSKASEFQLTTIDARLVRVTRRALGWGVIDFGVAVGHRGEAAQNAAFNARPQLSKLPWPKGKHNRYPSVAEDLVVLVNGKPAWTPRAPWDILAGVMFAAAAEEGVPIRWGGDWDGDKDVTDQDFNDLGHFELVL